MRCIKDNKLCKIHAVQDSFVRSVKMSLNDTLASELKQLNVYFTTSIIITVFQCVKRSPLTRCLPPYMPTELPRQATESFRTSLLKSTVKCIFRSFPSSIRWEIMLPILMYY